VTWRIREGPDEEEIGREGEVVVEGCYGWWWIEERKKDRMTAAAPRLGNVVASLPCLDLFFPFFPLPPPWSIILLPFCPAR
jgi:hypothetical protein